MTKKKFINFIFVLCLFSCKFKTNKEKDKNENIKSELKTHKEEYSAEEIYMSCKSATALILAYDENQIPISQGSGFFIEKNKLITNFHVVDGSTIIKVKPIGTSDFLVEARTIKCSKTYDIAIIETSDYTNKLNLDTTNKFIGKKIFAIGNPKGLEGTISEGIISGIRSDLFEVLQITAPISPGSSGGPVLDEKGKVIGISTFSINNGQNLNFAIPIKYIYNCIDYVKEKKSKIKVIKSFDGIVMTRFDKYYSEKYEHLSLKNNTSQIVKNIVGILVYKDMDNEITDFKFIAPDEIILPGLAKNIELESLNKTDRYHYYKTNTYNYPIDRSDKFKVEFRLLNYEIQE